MSENSADIAVVESSQEETSGIHQNKSEKDEADKKLLSQLLAQDPGEKPGTNGLLTQAKYGEAKNALLPSFVPSEPLHETPAKKSTRLGRLRGLWSNFLSKPKPEVSFDPDHLTEQQSSTDKDVKEGTYITHDPDPLVGVTSLATQGFDKKPGTYVVHDPDEVTTTQVKKEQRLSDATEKQLGPLNEPYVALTPIAKEEKARAEIAKARENGVLFPFPTI